MTTIPCPACAGDGRIADKTGGMTDRVHILYRFFAADGRLLYVGMTINPARRFEKHRGEKSWWSDVARVEIEHHETIDALRKAERRAIETEHPIHNIRMNGGGEKPDEQRPSSRCGLKVGCCYALGLDDGECPVGIVTALDDDGATVARMSFLTGCFDCGEVWVSYDSICRTLRAYEMSKAKIRADGWNPDYFKVSGIEQVFDTDPLAEFQTSWHHDRRPAPLTS